MHPQKVILYARVSSKEQEQGYSLEAQKQYLRDYAHTHNLLIVKEFIEAETAKKAGRSLFNQMLVYLDKHQDVRTIIVEKTDRLYRNFKDYVILEDYELTVHLAKENQVLNKDSRSHEKFIHGIKVLMAKNYIDNLSEEVKKGLLQKVKEGGYPRSAPTGYTNNLDDKTIEPDPETAPLVRQLFDWYASDRYSLRELRTKAKEAGFLDQLGKYKLSKNSIYCMLRNPVYCGKIAFRGDVYQGKHVPLVSEQQYYLVQEVLRRRTQPFTWTKDRFTFTGFIQCSECGCSICGELKKNKYVYYRCTRQKGPCDNVSKYVREEVIEEQFLTLLADIQIDEDRLAWLKQELRNSHDQEKTYHKDRLAKINADIDAIQQRLSQAYEDKLDGNITDGFWKEKFTEWTQKKESLTRDLLSEQNRNKDYYERAVNILDLVNRAHGLYKNQSKEGRQQILRFFLHKTEHHNSTMSGEKVVFELKKPFREILEAKKSKLWRRRTDSNRRPPA